MQRPVPIDFVAVSAYRGPQLTTPGNLYPSSRFFFETIFLKIGSRQEQQGQSTHVGR